MDTRQNNKEASYYCMNKPNVIIIMSTFNGERFVEQQIKSLLNQTFPSQIIIRDDGSYDNTVNIIKKFADQHSNIFIYQDDLKHKGLRESYLSLLNYAITLSPDYICYADQDDLWFPDKTEKLLILMVAKETKDQPTLVFSDVKVVNENLNVIHPSLSELQNLNNHDPITLKKLLFYCPALGCTIMLNKALSNLISQYAQYGKSINHDKWALVLSAIRGKIVYLPESTLLYRQHSSNTVGAMLGIKRKVFTLKNINFLKVRYRTALIQANDIVELPFLTKKDKQIIKKFIYLWNGNFLQRILSYMNFISTPPNWKRKAGLTLSLFLKYKD